VGRILLCSSKLAEKISWIRSLCLFYEFRFSLSFFGRKLCFFDGWKMLFLFSFIYIKMRKKVRFLFFMYFRLEMMKLLSFNLILIINLTIEMINFLLGRRLMYIYFILKFILGIDIILLLFIFLLLFMMCFFPTNSYLLDFVLFVNMLFWNWSLFLLNW
jgi:hypothetical protein